MFIESALSPSVDSRHASLVGCLEMTSQSIGSPDKMGDPNKMRDPTVIQWSFRGLQIPLKFSGIECKPF